MDQDFKSELSVVSDTKPDNFSSTITLTRKDVDSTLSVEDKSENDYNPFKERRVAYPITFFGALVHIVKGSLGTGILAIPSAFKYAGSLVGAVGTVLIGLLCTHTVYLLVDASEKACKVVRKPLLGFSDTAEAVFSNGPKRLRPLATIAKYFVDGSLFSTYIFVCSVYIVFIADHIKEVVDFYYPNAVSYGSTYYMLGAMVLLMLFCQVKQLKYLVPFSFAANATIILSFSITIYYMFRDIHNLDTNRPLAKHVQGYPVFFSTVLFAMEGIGTILPVENSLKKPQWFLAPCGILNIAMGIIIVLYTSIGLFGYFKWGDDVEASIIKNLPDNEIPAQVAKISIALAAFFTFMLQFWVPVNIIWDLAIGKKVPPKFYIWAQIGLRIGLVLLCTIIATSVPDLAKIIDIVGSVFFSTLGLLIPAVIDSVIKWSDELGVCYWKLTKNVIICVLSVVALIAGIAHAIES